MTQFEKGDIAVYRDGDKYLEVLVTVPPHNMVFIGIIEASSHSGVWPAGKEDAWSTINFFKKVDIYKEFNTALDNLESCYGKV